MSCREQALSNDYTEIMVDYILAEEDVEGMNYCMFRLDDQFAILYFLPREPRAINVSRYTYNSIPKLYGLMQDADGRAGGYSAQNLTNSGILQVQRPPLSLTGKGVIVGFVDTGIRYDMDVFRREDGTSRILSIWDQTIQDGTPPEGFDIGTEYTNAQINEALRSDDPFSIVPSTDEDGHGTAMASVAAGQSTTYGAFFQGAAPDADIVMVKCREGKQYLRDYYMIPEGVPAYSDADIGMAVKYLDQLARVGKRPVIICIGMGTNWGDHSGNSVLSRYLSRVAEKRNRVVVIPGGNEGNAGHHYGSLFAINSTGIEQTVEMRVGEGEQGFLMELWGSRPNITKLSIRSPGGETIPVIDFRSRETRNYSFVYERTRIAVDYVLVEQGSGDELVVMRFTMPTPGVWTFLVETKGETGYGNFNMWLPITQFLRSDTYFLRSTPYMTLTVPSMASSAITPSAYNADNNSFYIESSRGFVRAGGIKPDFAAPGVDVPTVLGNRSGSCMAVAITVGAAAQFMQWAVVEGNDVLAQSVEVKAYFIRGAVRDPGMIYPSRSWGFGRLNVARAFEIIAGTTSS